MLLYESLDGHLSVVGKNMIWAVLFVGLITAEPWPEVADCEINHVFETDGTYRFTQTIWWHWAPDGTRRVAAWKWTKECTMPVLIQGRYHVFFLDRCGMHRVAARRWYESWTTYDPELEDRGVYPRYRAYLDGCVR